MPKSQSDTVALIKFGYDEFLIPSVINIEHISAIVKTHKISESYQCPMGLEEEKDIDIRIVAKDKINFFWVSDKTPDVYKLIANEIKEKLEESDIKKRLKGLQHGRIWFHEERIRVGSTQIDYEDDSEVDPEQVIFKIVEAAIDSAIDFERYVRQGNII